MIEPLLGEDQRVADFVAARTDADRGFGPCVGIGWMDGDTMIAGTVYHHWYPSAGVVEMSSAADSPRWITRKSLQTMFGYPFGGLGCQMVVLRVSEHNTRMRNIAKRFGFTETIIPRLAGRNEAECIYCFTVEQWQDKGLGNGKKGRTGTA